MCNEIQNVGAIDFAHRGSKMTISTAFEIPIAESPCVGCGQCAAVCPTGAIVVKNHTQKVWEALEDTNTKVTVQIAPAVRVGLGKKMGMNPEENAMGKIVAALRRIGFDEIYDTSTGADLTVLEESGEFLNRIQKGEKLPLITSCCPAWVQYCEKNYPEYLANVSTCRSPMEMLASVVKAQSGSSSRRHVHVAVMPCTAKKYEAGREEFKVDGTPNVDYVITTQELIQMIRESGLLFNELEPEAIDMPYGTMTGAGVIFGVTGGVTEAVLRRLSSDKSRAALMAIAYKGVRGMKGVKETSIMYGEKEIKIAVVSGLKNASELLEKLKAGEHYDFIEVMACPGGCVSGAGQPFAQTRARESRGKGLYAADKQCSIKFAEENPIVLPLYQGILKGRVHELLHVDYLNEKE
jgi:NADH-quinone oxidoreductase subunit G